MSEVTPEATPGLPRVRKKKARRTAEGVQPTAQPVDIDQLRAEKLNDIQLDALQVRNPLQGALRGAAGDLLFLSHKMKQALVEMLEESGGVSPFDKATPTIELFLKVARQADRFAQLDQRMVETQREQADNEPPAGDQTEI